MGKLSVADKAKRCLEDAIACIAENRTEYVHNPASDFTRERKLNMGDTMRLILSMDGGSLEKELHEHSSISNVKNYTFWLCAAAQQNQKRGVLRPAAAIQS